MNKFLRAILIGSLVTALVFIMDILSPYKNMEHESLLNMITIMIITVIFSYSLEKIYENKKS